MSTAAATVVLFLCAKHYPDGTLLLHRSVSPTLTGELICAGELHLRSVASMRKRRRHERVLGVSD